MTETVFQPFTDRLSRDIRNGLSSALVEALEEGSLTAVEKAAHHYLKDHPHQVYKDYIDSRLSRYRRVMQNAEKSHQEDPLYTGLLLWDEQLFFEVHEILEHTWLKAEGDEKLFYQAMIRAAGVYIKLDAGYADPAARIAAKALPVLERNRSRLAQYTHPEKLFDALRQLSPQPPRLMAGE